MLCGIVTNFNPVWYVIWWWRLAFGSILCVREQSNLGTGKDQNNWLLALNNITLNKHPQLLALNNVTLSIPPQLLALNNVILSIPPQLDPPPPFVEAQLLRALALLLPALSRCRFPGMLPAWSRHVTGMVQNCTGSESHGLACFYFFQVMQFSISTTYHYTFYPTLLLIAHVKIQ